MKRTIVPVLIILLTGGIAVAVNRFLINHQPTQRASVGPGLAPIGQKTQTVSFEGISFRFDSSLASEIRSELIPAVLNGKASDIVPEHPAFTFVGYRRPSRLSPNSKEMRVFSLEKFREANSAVDYEVRTLKALLEKRPTLATLNSVIVKARRDRDNNQMPFLPMWEASQAFVSHLRYVNFKNGRGVFFVTQWNTETVQVNNDDLEYAFQGITDDGKYYVYAEFPIAAPFLPKGDEPDVIAWDEKNYLLSHKSKQYQDYLRPVLTKLEELPPDKFQPNLELLDRMIQSLEVKAK